jgi:hypothetical protein
MTAASVKNTQERDALTPFRGSIGRSEKLRLGDIPRTRPLPVLRTSLTCYVLTTLMVFLGMALGHGLFPLASPEPRLPSFSRAFANWDGGWYMNIVREGYAYAEQGVSSPSFFPAYPGLGWLVMKATGLEPHKALIIVSHFFFVAALVLFAFYVRRRYAGSSEHLPTFVLLAAALFPTGFFFRMAYAESLFLCACILAFYLMERRAPLGLVAVVIGVVTATRIPGIGLLVPFAWHVWRRSASKEECLKKLLYLAPLACWGIVAYVVFLWLRFGEPLAFIKSQNACNFRIASSWNQKIYCLAVGEPLRSVFDPSCPGFWKNLAVYKNPLFSLAAVNPFYFLLSLALVAGGAWRRWLSTEEWLFSAALLFISYVGRGYEMCMHSSGRYVSVVFPIYLVLGHLLCRCPLALATGILALAGAFLTIYSAFFAANHFFI